LNFNRQQSCELFAAEATDAPEFGAAAAAVLNGAAVDRLTLVKIDGYFRRRWLDFSGKTLGVLRSATYSATPVLA
jgi:hypothetical protein